MKNMKELLEILREIDEMFEADLGQDRHTGELITEARTLAKKIAQSLIAANPSDGTRGER